MDSNQEATFSGLTVSLILFTALLDPRVSFTLAIILLIVFSIYTYIQSSKR